MAIYIPTQTLHSQFRKIMKKFIEISEEALARLESGETIEGSMKKNPKSSKITFTAWNRKAPKHHRKDELIHQLESGWVKESAEKYKLFISVYKKLGLARIMNIIDREAKEAKVALFDKELIECV